jgi:small nuclear ribonucleoprotein (snRNP)-like protein
MLTENKIISSHIKNIRDLKDTLGGYDDTLNLVKTKVSIRRNNNGPYYMVIEPYYKRKISK